MISFCIANTAIAGTWERQDNGSWKYLNDDGTYAKGWIKDNGKDYFLGEPDGVMYSNQFVDGYYLLDDGSWIGNDWSILDHTDIYDFVKDIPDHVIEEPLQGVWNNEAVVRKASYKINQILGNRYAGPIVFHKNEQSIDLDRNNRETWYNVSYGPGGRTSYLLWSNKNRNTDHYQLDINMRVDDPLDRLGLEVLCLLIDDEVYEVVQKDYDEEFLQPDTWTTVGNYQYMVSIQVKNELQAGCVRYFIKEK